jgi:polyvinyl alcohol dehydrogenase (cytochrome)
MFPKHRLRLAFVFLALAALATASQTLAGSGGASWPTIGHDPADSRNQPAEHDISPATVPTLIPKWIATTTGDVSGTPAVAGGAVYFGDFGGTLWKLDADTGAVIWSHKVSEYTGIANDLARTSPSLDGNTLVVGSLQRPLMLGVDASTGALLWKTQVHPDTQVAGHGIMTGSPVLAGHTVITGVSATGASAPATATFRGEIVALDARTGQILWQTYSLPDNHGLTGGYAGSTMFSPPAVDVADRLVYGTFGQPYREPASVAACNAAAPNGFSESCEQPGSYAKSIVAFDLDTGAPVWSYRVQGHDPWVRACGSLPPEVTWCPRENDAEKWDLGGSGPNVFAIGNRNVVGVGGKSGVYYVLDAKTGQFIWNTLVGPGGDQGGFEWGTAYDGTRIYVSITNHHHIPYRLTENGVLSDTTVTGGSWAALDPVTGKILWQTADPQVETVPGFTNVGVWDLGPVTSANGIVYASSMAKTGNQFYALDAATGSILWSHTAGSSVNAAPAVVDGSVYWGTGYARSGVEGTGNTRLYAFGLALPLLASQIGGMGLEHGLANDLIRRLDDIEGDLGTPRACDGLSHFVEKVMGEAGREHPKLTIAQAETIIGAANAVEGQIDCADAATAKPQAEQDVLALLATLAGMQLDKGVANDLRSAIRDVGTQVARDRVDDACHQLNELNKKIMKLVGKKNGLTTAQALALGSASFHISAELGC